MQCCTKNLLQGVSDRSGKSNLPLRVRNLQVKISLKVIVEIIPLMKLQAKSLSLKQLQRYNCFFQVHRALFYNKVWPFW